MRLPGTLPTRPVFLIGFMGAGKTSVGKALAARLGWRFYDLDQVIEAREQSTVAEIFASAGESGFRQAESSALSQLLAHDLVHGDAIVALGGGAFAQEKNRAALESAGAITVLLEAPLEELERRCRNGLDVRPLARDSGRFRRLFAGRRRSYSLARFRVNTSGRGIEEVAQEIERILRNDSEISA